jgi:hypothetical protein
LLKLKNEQKVAECFKKCLKISSQCVDTNAQLELNLEILNYYIYYYENKNQQVKPKLLVGKIQEVLLSIKNRPKFKEICTFIFHIFYLKFNLNMINELAEKLSKDLAACEKTQENHLVFGYFERTLSHIKQIQNSDKD